jgi:3-hydroxyisobutyrate dehydrogenase
MLQQVVELAGDSRHYAAWVLNNLGKSRLVRTPRGQVEAGASWQRCPREVAERSDVVFTMVGFPSDLKQVYLAQDGILAGAKSGTAVCDMTTSEPSLAVRIHAQAAAKGIASIDAPVSGGDVGAREAKLAIMVGAEKKAFEAILPLLQKMGETVALMGGPGAGQHTKVANQIVITGNMIGMVEALLYTQKAGLGLDAMIDIVGKGAAASWSLNNLGRRIARGDFNPGFYIKHFLKDMAIALEEARRMKLSSPRSCAREPAVHFRAGTGNGESWHPGTVKSGCGHERRDRVRSQPRKTASTNRVEPRSSQTLIPDDGLARKKAASLSRFG